MITEKDVGIANFNYVMDIFLEKDDTSFLKKCLIQNGINDITSLISLRGELLDSLEYEDPTEDGVIIKPNIGDKHLIDCFIHYIKFLDYKDAPVKDNWTSLEGTDFDEFMNSREYNRFLNSGVLPWTSTVPAQHITASLAPTLTYSTAALFKGEINKDSS